MPVNNGPRSWRPRLAALLLLSQLASAAVAEESKPTVADRHRIDPAGIPGTLVLSGADVSDAALRTMLRRGKDERVVVLHGNSDEEPAVVERLRELAKDANVESVEAMRVGPKSDLGTLSTATAIWVAAADRDAAASILTKPVREALTSAAQRGATIGAAGPAVETLGLLPDAHLSLGSEEDNEESALDDLVQSHPGSVGYAIDSDAAMVVRGRRIGVVGDGAVRVVLPRCEWREEHVLRLEGPRAAADLTALRLSALDRFLPAYPSAAPPAPCVAKGTLIIIGGGGMPRGIVRRFVEAAGGEKARIVLLPTAVPDPVPERSRLAEEFREAGAAKVTILPGRTHDVVDGEASLKALREATGLWFGGGRQWRFADAYLGTEALELMHGVLERDGVIMGSSAGASIQGGYLARANPLGNRDIMAEGYERGLGFLPGVAIDQHFAQRRRFRDMTSLVDRYPQLLGIGIDEATALVVRGQRGEVTGRGEVHFYDRRQPVRADEPDHLSLPAGSVYDLVERAPVEDASDTDEPVTP